MKKEELKQKNVELTSDVVKYYELIEDIDKKFSSVLETIEDANKAVYTAVPERVYRTWREYLSILNSERSYNDKIEALNGCVWILEATQGILEEKEQ